ncbi:hypothetical protein FQN60_010040 [Etheostoma spectabile]|uniref:SH2 domain-containing protein n=1 Tax=Etheostoma spectabile TaxID=54343 RepID=A0A5J5D7Z3_9PERO|nr:hypothetical protein FQN60_010040 [Etheostoma spectabile]
MERNRTDRKRNQRCRNYKNVVEPQYDVVGDQEEAPHVRILPARPIHDEREYAGILGKSYLAFQYLATGCYSAKNKNPTYSHVALTDKRVTPVPPAEQLSHRRSPPPPPLTSELVKHLPELTLQEPCSRNGQKATKNADSSSLITGLQRAGSVLSLHTNHRHSLDLETHNFETRYAEHALHLVNKDGAFLVRDCSINTNSEPLVLAVYHEKKVYNIKIRFVKSTVKYALGTGQRSNDMFDSVADIVKFHSIFPILLVSGRNTPGSKCPENCVLTCPVTKRDVDQLLQ